MLPPRTESIPEIVRVQFEMTHSAFHALLASLSEEDWHRPSLNPGWTNGEILAHMLFGFIILNALVPLVQFWVRLPQAASKPFAGLLNASTRPFNWINAWGARMQSKVFTYRRLGRMYDWVYNALLKKINSIKAEEWALGMYYPTRWDPNFEEFMTLEKLFHYPVAHFNFHRAQIAH